MWKTAWDITSAYSGAKHPKNEEPMSHHASGPNFGFPRGDARLDMTSSYTCCRSRSKYTPGAGEGQRWVIHVGHAKLFAQPPQGRQELTRGLGFRARPRGNPPRLRTLTRAALSPWRPSGSQEIDLLSRSPVPAATARRRQDRPGAPAGPRLPGRTLSPRSP